MNNNGDDQSTPQSQPKNEPSNIGNPQAMSENADRTELLRKARAFLGSPQVRREDDVAKRRFLTEKGLTDIEIDRLLQEIPPQTPLVPPRTYPQPPPSNLPNLLIGLARIVSWIAGGSAALLLLYFRLIYPKIAHTFQARRSLQTHQRDLLTRLTTRLRALKTTQEATFAVLPKAEPFTDTRYGHCRTLDEVVSASEDKRDVPESTLLRCAIEDLTSQGRKATTEEIVLALETKLPWLKSEEDTEYREKLWQTLSASSLFSHEDVDGTSVWSYTAPVPPPPPPLLASLNALRGALPETPPQQTSHFQHALKALSDLTGYITAQTYLPSGIRTPGILFGTPLDPEEEEVRREIRALKGLLLNRRSFMPPTAPKPWPKPHIAPSSSSSPGPIVPIMF
ncbi:hypothetical protein AcW1_004963 [Taiwanofungus camphoratus]|nr:hypothetical protein AcW1_004963 [Antrodia cinnamomea]